MENVAQKAYYQVDKVGVLAMSHWVVLYVHCFLDIFKGRLSTISHINYWDQVNSWENLWKFWNGPLCRNKSGPSPLLNVAVYWQSSDTETCVKKLSEILANNIDNGGREIGLRIYVRYCLKKLVKNKRGFGKT